MKKTTNELIKESDALINYSAMLSDLQLIEMKKLRNLTAVSDAAIKDFRRHIRSLETEKDNGNG